MAYRFVLAAVLLASPAAFAEEAASARSQYLVVRHEEIKPGSMTVHDQQAAAFQAVQRRIGAGMNWIGLRPIAGNDNSVLYLEPWDSLEAIEAAEKKVEQVLASDASIKTAMDDVNQHGDVHSLQRTMIMRYRGDLALAPRSYEEVARSRYLQVMWVRTKPGRGPDYVDWVKGLNAARTKAGVEAHFSAYSAISGSRTGTFLFMTSYPSLKAYDEWLAQGDARDKAVEGALGGSASAKERRAAYAELVDEQSVFLYAMAPHLSQPTEKWIAYDPQFWKVTPAAPAKATASKKEAKP